MAPRTLVLVAADSRRIIAGTGGFPRVVQREDVRLLQLGRELDLTEEALSAERSGELGAEHLESH